MSLQDYRPLFEKDQVIFDLTELGLFSGLYESLWLNPDKHEDLPIDQIVDDLKIDTKDLDIAIDIAEYLKQIASVYINRLTSDLDIPYESMELFSIYSPPFYNYDTDQIELVWKTVSPESDWERLIDYIENNYYWYDGNPASTFEMEVYEKDGYYLYAELATYQYFDGKNYHNIDYDIEKDAFVLA